MNPPLADSPADLQLAFLLLAETGLPASKIPRIISLLSALTSPPNCIMENFTVGSIVASGKMLLSSRYNGNMAENSNLAL
jgi:hypothetical protein